MAHIETDAPEPDTTHEADPGTAKGSTDNPVADPATDGRRARSTRSRRAMVDSLLDLLREGNLRPSSAQIAERAGVTQRTLFNQFGDMESLIEAAATRQAQRVLSLLPEAGTGTLTERATNYCGGLQILLEETMHVRWAVVSNPHATSTGTRAVGTAREFMRAHVADAFADELDDLSDTVHDQVLDALELEIDPAAWRLRRVEQGLSADEARGVVERVLLAVLRDAVR